MALSRRRRQSQSKADHVIGPQTVPQETVSGIVIPFLFLAGFAPSPTFRAWPHSHASVAACIVGSPADCPEPGEARFTLISDSQAGTKKAGKQWAKAEVEAHNEEIHLKNAGRWWFF